MKKNLLNYKLKYSLQNFKEINEIIQYITYFINLVSKLKGKIFSKFLTKLFKNR